MMFSQAFTAASAVILILCHGQVSLAGAPSGASARTINSTASDELASSNFELGPDQDGKYAIQAPGIRALFVPYGASISNLFIKDQAGIERDIVLGFDNATYYTQDGSHPHLNGVPGRYANRIKNSTFQIDGQTFHVTPNENHGANTVHGGPDGWDYRNFTVVSHTTDSITFALVDPDGKEGFPGEVVSYITYTVSDMAWHIKMSAMATTKKTPLMLTSHTYLNLDGFQNPETPTILNHSLHIPNSKHRIGVDSFLIPDGSLLENEKGSVNDFWSTSKQIGDSIGQSRGNCGPYCTGYDNCYLIDQPMVNLQDWVGKGPVATLSSAFSGIKLDIFSDQEAIQLYTSNFQDGTLALKGTQGFFNDPTRPRVLEKYGSVVLEVQDWVDGINQPQWGRGKRQIFGPQDGPYVLQALYNFTVVDGSAG